MCLLKSITAFGYVKTIFNDICQYPPLFLFTVSYSLSTQSISPLKVNLLTCSSELTWLVSNYWTLYPLAMIDDDDFYIHFNRHLIKMDYEATGDWEHIVEPPRHFVQETEEKEGIGKIRWTCCLYTLVLIWAPDTSALVLKRGSCSITRTKWLLDFESGLIYHPVRSPVIMRNKFP